MGKRKKKDIGKKKSSNSESHSSQQREHRPRTPRKKMNPGTIVMIVLLGGLVLYSVVVAMGGGSGGGDIDPNFDYEEFSSCMLESDAIFYGTNWCQFCQEQKRMLGPTYDDHGDEFFVDCDANAQECQSAGVTSYPTWVIGDQRLTGVQELSTLASAMDCTL